VIMTTCQAHGAAGFTNLLVTKEDGIIVLNPHIANCCVLRLDEQAAIALYTFLGSGWDELVPAVDGWLRGETIFAVSVRSFPGSSRWPPRESQAVHGGQPTPAFRLENDCGRHAAPTDVQRFRPVPLNRRPCLSWSTSSGGSRTSSHPGRAATPPEPPEQLAHSADDIRAVFRVGLVQRDC
jgi:hypothetical protein